MLLRRSLRTKGSRIALFALWLQIALSFGHIHPEDIFGPIGHAVAQGHGITQVSSDGSAAPQGPSKHGAAAAFDDGCAICASMMLAASLVLPDPINLALPLGAVQAALPEPVSFVIKPAPYLLFERALRPSPEIERPDRADALARRRLLDFLGGACSWTRLRA